MNVRLPPHILLFIALAAALVFLAFFSARAPTSPPLSIEETYHVETLHLACTPTEKRTGLARYASLGEHEAMLFPFAAERNITIWMKDMRFPIDIFWIAANGTIRHIEQNVPLCGTNCTFAGRGKYVLETTAGTADRYGIEEGDRAVIRAHCVP